MTGAEKLESLRSLIADSYSNLIKGNQITLHSSEIENAGIPLDEQTLALEVLRDDEHIIVFEEKYVFENKEDIPPQDRVDIIEVAMMAGVTEQEILNHTLEQKIYLISILPKFSDSNPIENNTASLKFKSMSIPVVIVDGEEITFPGMRDGAPLAIVSFCLQNYPNKQLDLTTLKSEMKKAGLNTYGINNINEKMRKSIFGETMPLSIFVTSSPKAITVHNPVKISTEKLLLIKNYK